MKSVMGRSAGHDRKLGVLPRLSAYLLQRGYFLFSIKKSHILAYFIKSAFRNSHFRNDGFFTAKVAIISE